MSDEIAKMIQHIEMVFPRSVSPNPDWQGCESVEDFVRRFGEEFFIESWRYMHDNFADTRFLFPFMLQYFLTTEGVEDVSLATDLFIGTLDPVAQKAVQYDYYVEQFFANLTEEQRKVVCEWLNLMEKKRVLVNVRDAKNYWCGKHG